MKAADGLRDEWTAKEGCSVSMAEFFRTDLRLRFDDLAVAGLTELQDHAFYSDLIDEMSSLPVASLPDPATGERPEPGIQ